MSMSSLRRHAASAVIAAGAAAAAVLALAVPAGAGTGTTEISPEQAGYTATGAQFDEVQATVYLRNPAQYSGEVSQYGHSVQLWSSDLVAVVGVTTSTSGSSYTPYATIYNRSTHQVIASDPDAFWCDDHDNCSRTIGTFAAGDSVLLTLTYDPRAGVLGLQAFDNNTGDAFINEPAYTVGTGVSFTQARVGTEFGGSPWDASYSYTPPAQSTKAAAYTGVALTTYSGHTSTLWSWWVHHKLLANTGQQSGSDRVAIPTDLTSGGASFQTWLVPQNRQSPDQPVLH
jgi:hypothetical protein